MKNPTLPAEALTRRLARKVLSIGKADLTPLAIQQAKTCLIDAIGVSLAGSVEDATRILLRTPGVAQAPGRCRVIGTSTVTSALDAALVNGTAAHALDYDDFSSIMGGHHTVPLMPVLLDFADQQPFIELIMDLSDQRANLIEEGLDLSIRITAELQPGDIVRKLGQCRLLTLASPDYLAQHGEPRHPSDLRQHECLIYASDTAVSTWSYRDKGQTLQVPVRGRIVANNGAALTEGAARGMGITRQPDFIAAPYLAQGRVRAVLQDFENAPLGIYAVLPSNRYIPHRVSVLIEHLARVLQAQVTQVAQGQA